MLKLVFVDSTVLNSRDLIVIYKIVIPIGLHIFTDKDTEAQEGLCCLPKWQAGNKQGLSDPTKASLFEEFKTNSI